MRRYFLFLFALIVLLLPCSAYNIFSGLSYMDEAFLHRNNYGGGTKAASKGCLIIDSSFWPDVEKQLGESQKIYIILKR